MPKRRAPRTSGDGDARATIPGVHHDVHRPGRTWDRTQGGQTYSGVGKVMEYADAHDQVGAPPKLLDTLDRQTMNLEVVQFVATPNLVGGTQARLANVDGNHPSAWSRKGAPRALGGAASCDEHVEVFAERLGGKQKVNLGVAPAWLPPAITVTIEVVGRRRVWMAVVELGD